MWFTASKFKRNTHSFRHVFHRLHAGAIQIVIVLARFNELVLLDVLLHLLPGGHKVVVPPIHLILPLRPRGVFGKSKKKMDNARWIYYSCITVFWPDRERV